MMASNHNLEVTWRQGCLHPSLSPEVSPSSLISTSCRKSKGLALLKGKAIGLQKKLEYVCATYILSN